MAGLPRENYAGNTPQASVGPRGFVDNAWTPRLHRRPAPRLTSCTRVSHSFDVARRFMTSNSEFPIDERAIGSPGPAPPRLAATTIPQPPRDRPDRSRPMRTRTRHKRRRELERLATAATKMDRPTFAQAQGRGIGGKRSGRSLSMANQAAKVRREGMRPAPSDP